MPRHIRHVHGRHNRRTPVRPAASQPKPTGVSGSNQGMIPDGPLVPNGVRMPGTYYGVGGASIEFLGEKPSSLAARRWRGTPTRSNREPGSSSFASGEQPP